jgi:hypothetical protein
MVFGDWKTGAAREDAKAVLARAAMPTCRYRRRSTRSAQALVYDARLRDEDDRACQQSTLQHWDRNRESNRAWLSLNMMTEANAGCAVHYGRDGEIDFIRLRSTAEGARWNKGNGIAPWAAGALEKV